MSDKSTYVAGGDDLGLIRGGSKVVNERFFDFGEYGTVSATFDFSNLDPCEHGCALRLVSKLATRVHVHPSVHEPVPEPIPEPTPFFKKLWNKIKEES